MFSLFFNHGSIMEGAVSASVFSPLSGNNKFKIINTNLSIYYIILSSLYIY